MRVLSAVGASDDSPTEQQPDLEMGDGGAFWQQGQDGGWFLMDPPPRVVLRPRVILVHMIRVCVYV